MLPVHCAAERARRALPVAVDLVVDARRGGSRRAGAFRAYHAGSKSSLFRMLDGGLGVISSRTINI